VVGYHVAFAGSAIVLAVGALLLLVLLRRRDLAAIDVEAAAPAVA
jgi:uncharacterized protein (TIGR03382 family)